MTLSGCTSRMSLAAPFEPPRPPNLHQASAAGHRADNHERLLTVGHTLRQRRIRLLVGQIRFTRVEPHKGPPPSRHPVADCAAKCRKLRFDSVEHRSLRDLTIDVDADLALDSRQRP